jgi:hypothetical protein
MQYIHTGLAGLLWIKQGRQETGYMVEDTSAYTNADASTYRLTKTEGTVYNVLLDGPGSLCDCIGFENRGMGTKDGKGCKHVAALTTLRQRNLI